MKTIQQVEKLTQYFVHQLSGPAHLLWAIYLRQALMTGAEWAVGAILSGIAILIVVRGWKRWTEDDDGGMMTLLGFIFVAALIMGIVSLFQAIQWLGNPAYQAARLLLHGGA